MRLPHGGDERVAISRDRRGCPGHLRGLRLGAPGGRRWIRPDPFRAARRLCAAARRSCIRPSRVRSTPCTPRPRLQHRQKTPRPFDKDRDGLVCGEGSGILLLEDYERAKSRSAKIYAEVIGFTPAEALCM